MKVIWKYKLVPATDVLIDIPKDSQFLCVQTQYNEPQMWFLVDTDEPKVRRIYKIYGTGHPMPDNPGTYLGTFQIDNGSLVFHVFEID